MIDASTYDKFILRLEVKHGTVIEWLEVLRDL